MGKPINRSLQPCPVELRQVPSPYCPRLSHKLMLLSSAMGGLRLTHPAQLLAWNGQANKRQPPALPRGIETKYWSTELLLLPPHSTSQSRLSWQPLPPIVRHQKKKKKHPDDVKSAAPTDAHSLRSTPSRQELMPAPCGSAETVSVEAAHATGAPLRRRRMGTRAFNLDALPCEIKQSPITLMPFLESQDDATQLGNKRPSSNPLIQTLSLEWATQ
ncbi:hypothetical protein Cgig2_015607 [Carnegiea gigantea]|uniref:Uncharacterized protein n=1 Tax=Carnegiea gigantea TaxID=171969 RepID=A0A9Q1JP59_9CARY|nr:hypothetical protein Cgig2_015607 [Carnegiea gigantea]